MASRSSKSKPFSKTAISSFVSGLFGLPLVGTLTASMAIVLGHTAIWKCKKENLRGRRLAITGLILGYLSLFLTFLLVVAGVGVGMTKSDEIREEVEAYFFQKRVVDSYASAARLFLACETYASKNGERYPLSWGDLSGRYLTRNDLNRLLKSSYPNGPEVSFRLVPHERPPIPALLDSTVVIQEIAPPNVKQVVVVYADGNSDLVPNPDVEFEYDDGLN